MAEWVALRPIFDVCTRDMGYYRGGKLRVPWWRQATAEKQMKVMVEDILAAARVQWRRESGRHGKRREVRRGVSQTENGRDKAGNISMRIQRQVNPRWADDPVRRHNVRWWRGWRGRRGLPPPEGHQTAGRGGDSGPE